MALDWPLVRSLLPHLLINLLLSLSNKHTLNQFPFPWTFTVLHAATTCLGSYILSHRPSVEAQPRNTARPSYTATLLFSSLFTINIAVSNLSLKVASLAFHQVVRSTSPLFVLLIQRLWSNTCYSRDVHLAVSLMCVGIVLTTVGDFYITNIGFLLTVLGTALASVKTIATNILLTGSNKVSATDLLKHTSAPAAIQALIFAYLTGEVSQICQSSFSSHIFVVVGINVLLAFLQNTFSFRANRAAGPLTMTVVGNLKQLATIVVGVFTFKTQVSLTGAAGMSMALGGSGWYSFLSMRDKGKVSR